MKKAVYWIMGERAGRTIVGTWNWLWGMPVESGGKVAVAVAEESLQSMQEAVQKLAVAVAAQEGAYKTAKNKYEAKIKEFNTLEQQAMVAQKGGNEEGARMAMSKAIQTEQILPKLAEMVKQAETAVKASKDKLNRERVKLESYKADMQNMKDMSEVNEALAMIAKVNNEFDIGSAKSDFEKARGAVERRNLQTEALAELSENPTEKLQAEIETMTLDDEVARRLQRLQDSPSKQLPE
ncbi:PspA/IM30 family protein [Dolichospermum sp. LEGE 00240]|jgi:phage shock protein A|uniref:PspA/IM30 family protein n=1 Tax=Dolichospermum sp. LEGE 00240 TaxID=1828603 RepID=UPI001881D24C|nr:PspA/IM30 family protein [Dolichospermum sp. LEGE 00240]MBE9250600.1 PspA/IM30 family protein [Dolichospermum sp. LEGE 00240]MDM3844300.1 PspA/IM30 family protein [Aphanizomenon gracile PMC638.10]MDM3851794.1 PspA/IM30 family protein [Aphanizomenon gracile PMC627.10]MDM3860355.1 PspA/IM30 family protein [Aphanizomenon gracile PMC644.10]